MLDIVQHLLFAHLHIHRLHGILNGHRCLLHEIDGAWHRWHGQHVQALRTRQRGGVKPFVRVDVVACHTDTLTAQLTVIAATAVFVHQGAQHVVSPRAIGQGMEEIEGYAVLPTGECQQVVVRLGAEQHGRLLRRHHYPRLRVILQGIVLKAVVADRFSQPHAIVWVTLLCGGHGLAHHSSVDVVTHLDGHTYSPAMLWISPVSVESFAK